MYLNEALLFENKENTILFGINVLYQHFADLIDYVQWKKFFWIKLRLIDCLFCKKYMKHSVNLLKLVAKFVKDHRLLNKL